MHVDSLDLVLRACDTRGGAIDVIVASRQSIWRTTAVRWTEMRSHGALVAYPMRPTGFAGTGRNGSHARCGRAGACGERSEPPLMVVEKILTGRHVTPCMSHWQTPLPATAAEVHGP